MTFFISPVSTFEMADIPQFRLLSSSSFTTTFSSTTMNHYANANAPRVPMECHAEFFHKRRDEQSWSNSLAAEDDRDFDELVSRLAQQGTSVQTELCNKDENLTKIQRMKGDDGFCSARVKKQGSSSSTASADLLFGFSRLYSTFMAEIDRTNWYRAGNNMQVQRAIKDIHNVFQSLHRSRAETSVVMSFASSKLGSIMAMILEMISATLSSAAIFSAGQDPVLVTCLLPACYKTLSPVAARAIMRALSICVTTSTATRQLTTDYNRTTGAKLKILHHSQDRARPQRPQAPAGPGHDPCPPAVPDQGCLSNEVYDLVAQSVQPLSPRRRASVGAILQHLEMTMLQLTSELTDTDFQLSKLVANAVSLIVSSAIRAVSWTHISWPCSYLSLPTRSAPFLKEPFHRCGQWTTWDIANLLKVISLDTPRAKALPLLSRESALIYHWMEWFRGVFGRCSIVSMTHYFGESWSQPVKGLYQWKKKLINSVLLEMFVVQEHPFFIDQGLFRVEFRAAKALEVVNKRIVNFYGGSIDLYVRELYPSGHLIPPGCKDAQKKVTIPTTVTQSSNDRKRKSIV